MPLAGSLLCGWGVEDTPRWVRTSGEQRTESGGGFGDLAFVCNEAVLSRERGPGPLKKIAWKRVQRSHTTESTRAKQTFYNDRGQGCLLRLHTKPSRAHPPSRRRLRNAMRWRRFPPRSLLSYVLNLSFPLPLPWPSPPLNPLQKTRWLERREPR